MRSDLRKSAAVGEPIQPALFIFLGIKERTCVKNKTKIAFFSKYVYAFENLRTRLRLIYKKRKGLFVQKEESTPVRAK